MPALSRHHNGQNMTEDRIRIVQYALLAAVLLGAGCRSQGISRAPTRIVCEDQVTAVAIMQAAMEVLTGMHFPIEKLDAREGIVRTRPLRAAQFFEFWRSDNANPSGIPEANLHTIRRSVELRVTDDSGRWSVDCDVSVQRLSLPENKIASISQAYQMHTQSIPALQRLDVSPQQQQGMAWIDLGKDPYLAAEILKRITEKLKQPKERKAT